MDTLTKKPDQKLTIGAKIAIITNIITIVTNTIFVILSIVGVNIFSKIVNKSGSKEIASLNDFNSGLVIVIFVISLLFVVAIPVTIIVMCRNILKAKASSGLIVGILILVIGCLTSITYLINGNGAFIGVNVVLSGLNIAAGVLLIMGKYVLINNDIEVVESEVTKQK